MYTVGEIQNGHQWTGTAWVPAPAQAAPPPPPFAPPPAPPSAASVGQGTLPPVPSGYAPQSAPTPPSTGGQPGRILTDEARLSYFYVLVRDKKNKQRVTLLFPKSNPTIKAALDGKVQEALFAKWKGSPPPYYRNPIKDGDTYRNQDTGKPLGDECKGHWVINAVGNDKTFVEVIDQYGFKISAPNAVKAGDYGLASVTFFGYEKDGMGVGVALNSIMFTRQGIALVESGAPAEQEFSKYLQQAPAGYVPPGAGYQAPSLPPPGYSAPPPAAAGGFAPPPQSPSYQAPPPAAQPMVQNPVTGVWEAPGTQQAAPSPPPAYAPPPAPPAPPSGPPPGAPRSPDGLHWWDAAANQWVRL